MAVGSLTATALADVGINIAGADATDTQDCRNVAPAPRPHGSQVNLCDATATGGNASLDNVDIYFNDDSSVQANGGAVDVIHASGGNATATAVCQNSGGSGTVHQVSICTARAAGGNVDFRNVQILIEHSDGSVSTLRRTLSALAPARGSRVAARCIDETTALSRCDGTAAGGSMLFTDVDVVDHDAGTTRTNVDLSVTGGNATATVLCSNVANGSGPRVQINKCTANATGGDVSLVNVRLHVIQTAAAR